MTIHECKEAKTPPFLPDRVRPSVKAALEDYIRAFGNLTQVLSIQLLLTMHWILCLAIAGAW